MKRRGQRLRRKGADVFWSREKAISEGRQGFLHRRGSHKQKKKHPPPKKNKPPHKRVVASIGK